MIKSKFIGIFLWTAMILFLWQAGAHLAWSQCDVDLPDACPAEITMEVATPEFVCQDNTLPLQFNSYFDVTLSGVQDNFSITNGTFPGWCPEAELLIVTSPPFDQGYQYEYQVSTYSSLDPPDFLSQDPSNIPLETWNKVNALLNIKGDTPWFIVQLSIWSLLRGDTSIIDNPNAVLGYDYPYACPEVLTEEAKNKAKELFDQANSQNDFVPGPGEKLAIILLPVDPDNCPERFAQEPLGITQLVIIEATCPYGSLGDRVWEDLNGNGIQDCEDTNDNGIIGDADDTGAECNAGISDVKVYLVDCDDPNVVLDSRKTDASGFYLFDNLTPGKYCVQFDLTNVSTDFCDYGEPKFTTQNASNDDALDSDADPETGVAPAVDLGEGETNRSVDAGIVCPGPASLGDRVWKDRNGDGVQDCEDTSGNGIIGDEDDMGAECDAGISGVTVDLLDCQTLEVLGTTDTDASGFYLFDNLTSGEYCVRFDLTTVPTYVCDFGAPQFTTQNAGNDDALDSDVDPTGAAPAVVLGEGETNRSVDAGIRCPGPASLGDRVWEDLNGDGIQNCEDSNNNGIIGDIDLTAPDDETKSDQGNECDAGISGVTVDLLDCQTFEVLDTTYTDASGFYLFDNLNPGEYCVQFDLDTVPQDVCDFGAPQFTTQNSGNDDVDSDADPDTGVAPSVTLDEGETNRSVDAGIVCQECAIAIDKKCLVAPPAPGPFDCDGKVDALKMVWNGPGILQSITALPGGSDSFPKVSITDEGGKQVVAVIDYQPSINDVIWEWQSDTHSGQSIFHLSCSDDEMDGETDDQAYPQDCGRPEGNGKSNDDKYDNVWLLDGLETDKGFVLDCTPLSAEPLNDCVFEAMPPPNCETLGKPTSLIFRYTGAGCSASSNNQGDKSDCTGEPGSAPISITILKDSSKITVSPVIGINIGDLVTLSVIESDMGSEVQLDVGGQFLKFHTSCSQPLAVGDVFGSLELVQFNGQGSGAEVTYFYEVKNIGDIKVDVTSVFDDQIGELLETPTFQLQSGDSFTLDKTAFISETTTNVVTAEANLFATEIPCGKATDQVTVTVVEPTCDVAIAFDELEDEKIKWKITNTSEIVATLDTLTVNFPPEYGLIKEVKLDGGVYKKGDSTVYPDGVPSGSTIGQNDWTESDVSKRQLDPGETRTLEVVFTQKSKGEGWVLINSAGEATFKEGCEVELPAPSGCEIGKPTALVFQYTGEGCVDGNDQADDKWSCSGDPSGAQPVQIVMTKDADKFDIDPSTMSIFVGETFEIRMKEDGKEFPSEIKFDIRNGQTLQSLKMHTSCSQPLSVGDQFGSVIVTEFFPKP